MSSKSGSFDSHLDRQAGVNLQRNAQTVLSSADDEETHFGRIGQKPLLMVRFCPAGGKGRSLSYALLCDISIDGQSELVLTFTDYVVTIKGWGLGRLLDHLESHRAKQVGVVAPGKAEFGEKAQPEGVASIEIEPVK